MARRNLSAVVRYLQQLAGPARHSGARDAELLERYVRHRDEAAFELLLWRHGAMVHNVCRRILPQEQDAEDAFQATFLAFVRKAGSISRRGSVAGWLYKVAYRVALEARERARKTAAVEKPGGELRAVQPASDPAWSDVRPILDEELNRLPERLRRPLVLCYLEGKSNAEAARELGCRLGTIYSRLSRGRELLRRRLLRRGVTLSIAALTAHAVEAAPAISLVRTTVQAALAFAGPSVAAAVSPRVAMLAEGVLRTMFVTKLKIAAVMVFVATVLAAGGVLSHGLTATPQPEAKAKEPPKPKEDDKKDAKPVPVKVVKPKKGGLPKTDVEEVQTQVAQHQELVPLVSGKIKQVAVDIGDPVKKGQVLIVIDAPLVEKDVEQAAAALEMALARMAEPKVAVNEAHEAVKRNIGTKSKLERAKAALKASQANVRLAQVALDKAKIRESFTRLRAEFDGVVAERNGDPGNLVQSGASGAQKPLLTLVRVDSIRIKMLLPRQFARVAELGDMVDISTEGVRRDGRNNTPIDLLGNPKDFITGKITGISPIADGPNSTRTVIIDVANPGYRIVPGEYNGVQIFFNRTRKPDAFTVPLSCVVRGKSSDGKDVLYVVRNGKAHIRKVKIGNILDEKCDIIEGIQANDLVIIKPGEWNEGTPVKIEKAP